VIQLLNRPDTAAAMSAKLEGPRVLRRVLGECNLDFVVLCSSLTSILGTGGRTDYCAANAYLDAFARDRSSWKDTRVIAVNWDTWREAGMAVDARLAASMVDQQRQALSAGMSSAEGVEALCRILARYASGQVVVSTRDLRTRIERSGSTDTVREPSSLQPASQHARPDVPTPYVEPRTETEQEIAATWRQYFGFDRIGIHDSFFELGGHSLLAIQLLPSIRERFGIDLPLPTFFELGTIEKLATHIDAARWAVDAGGTARDGQAQDRDEIEL
jgi:acyl carrier protein